MAKLKLWKCFSMVMALMLTLGLGAAVAVPTSSVQALSYTNKVAAGTWHTVGLKSDGTVVAVGSNTWGECNVSSWTDIVQVSAGCTYTVGLKSDGTVVAVGYNGDHSAT